MGTHIQMGVQHYLPLCSTLREKIKLGVMLKEVSTTFLVCRHGDLLASGMHTVLFVVAVLVVFTNGGGFPMPHLKSTKVFKNCANAKDICPVSRVNATDTDRITDRFSPFFLGCS